MYWLIVQLNIANLGTRIPDKYFRQKYIIFKSFNFEKHGKFWNKWFYVRKWKHKILDGHQLNQNIYDQRHLMTINTDEIEKNDYRDKEGRVDSLDIDTSSHHIQ